MKNKVCFVITFVTTLIYSAYAQDKIDYLVLNKIKTVQEIIIENIKTKITVKLDENQKKEFLNNLSVVKSRDWGKCLLPYEVTIIYDDKSISFRTNGKTLGQFGTMAMYDFESDLKLLINSFFIMETEFPLYLEKTVKVKNQDIHLYQVNYSRKNLKFIQGLSSSKILDETHCRWKIGQELIDIQSSFTEKELKKHIEKENLKEVADYYIKELCKRDLFFSTYELHPLDEVNEKWIIYFVYVEKEHKGTKKYWDEVVFMLPDGTIVISENNFEEIKF
ncbi:MAG TPA: hypothetical protein DEA57_08280 [Sulfurihydrogenibium sp.]|uniref:Uncharacterized protein n=1 Tax=Treponema denticola (strain ATCC 35405 / DSM 14222 / CIP 103919 / JCM 8153 / KCTC 15104) TaxID=243275 RepID=Q73LM3_TREDE|nr:hypothetical protein [Treponema denticola]HBT99447.1 hypothetical protein [Sulfurihydrogenibium sp.]AAS12354.1 hypothetical protein TDE_1839 [Treponema denticola ATCC 35405]EMB25314.1 hypothetical protein HMPREF9724_00934 [Treponema denticola SP37]EMB38047.1 hypothetical protein HMPREF9735_01275 [Treponema denticola ATCC 33521]EMB39735.1 hypothetical protein HMPREF9721_00559 [Treponema denticola ATCC 35404]